MKKIALFLFVAVAVIAFGTGTARADRGFWFHSTSAGWTTYFNITNTSSTAVAATVTFYGISAPATALGSTVMTIQPNGQWNFNTGAVGATGLTTTGLEAAVRGTATISGATANVIHGHTTQANATFSGFDLSIQGGSNGTQTFETTGE